MLINELEKRKKQLASYMETCRKYLKSSPSGYLRVSVQGEQFRFYRKKDKSDKQGVYCGDRNLISRLAKKEYAERVLKAAQKELKAIVRFIAIEKKQPVVKAFTGMHPGKQILVKPLEDTMESRIRQFNETAFPSFGFKPGSHAVVVDDNHLVRSAAEYRIETSLRKAGIPFKYESLFMADDGSDMRPDFMIMNPRTGQVFYWEHFGMLDRQDYRDRMMNNLGSYELSGIFPGNGLITTFDDGKHPLQQEHIDRIIRTLLT